MAQFGCHPLLEWEPAGQLRDAVKVSLTDGGPSALEVEAEAEGWGRSAIVDLALIEAKVEAGAGGLLHPLDVPRCPGRVVPECRAERLVCVTALVDVRQQDGADFEPG